MEVSSGSHPWNVSFIKVAHDWEVEAFAMFFNLLYSSKAIQGGEDKLCWIPSKRRLFDVRSFYNVLVPYDGTLVPWNCIWRNKVPFRAALFAWLAALGKILTLDNLRKRYVILVDWCCMCKR